jgi:hypothetical protein
LPDGIHELVLVASNSEALRQCFSYLDDLFAGASQAQPLLILSDIRQSGIPSPHLLWQFARALLTKHPSPPRAYNAVLQNQNAMVKVFMVVMAQLARLYGAQVRFFRDDEREQAIAWLKQQSAALDTPSPD